MLDNTTASKQLDNSLLTAYDKAAEILRNTDPEIICIKTGATYSDSSFMVTFLGSDYTINMPQVSFKEQDALLILQVMILHYFTAAGDETIESKLVSFSSLKGGMFYYHSFKQRVLSKLTSLFVRDEAKLISVVETLGRGQWTGSNYSSKISIFPKLDLLIQLFPGDDEFPSSVNVLFSDNIVNYLPIEDIAFLGGYVLKTLERAVINNTT